MRRPFRPARTVTDPWGCEWKLFVSRGKLPDWQEGDTSLVDSAAPTDGMGLIVEIPIALVAFLWSSVLFPLLRFLFLLPFAVVKGRRSQAARIEAICFFPTHETRTWTTTVDQVDSVVNQIALGLEEGKVVQPIGAVYSGSREG